MARDSLLLAIDQGTTNTKVLLMGRGGEVTASASRPLAIGFPQPAWVEQDPEALWRSVVEAAEECLAQAPGAAIAGIGISNQRESVVAWERKTGKPIGPCVIWQCRRTAERCAELRARGLDSTIRERSGLAIDPLFSASKAAWLLESVAGGRERAERGEICIGTVDSWLLWNLTGGSVHATDASNASRTQLLNLRRVEWDEELLEVFGIPAACLPRVLSSSGVFGHTAAVGKIPAGVPVASMIGDSHAALFGHAAFAPGTVKATYGTGSSLMTLADAPIFSRHGLSATIAWMLGGKPQYALEGNITNTGAAVQWVGEFLGLQDPVRETAALAETVEDSEGVYLVPAFSGLGAPVWDAEARGLLCGLTRGSRAAHAARAAVESIAYQVHDVFDAMRQDAGIPLPSLRADGGASRNNGLMQFQADVLHCPVIRSGLADLSVRGAAWLAGLAVGMWDSPAELEAMPQESERFDPSMPAARRAGLLTGWHEARGRALSAAAIPVAG